MSKVKNQHYVPQFYLNNFAFKKSKLWYVNVFDKFEQKQFAVPVSQVASQRYFYDLSDNLVAEGNTQIVEKILAKYEERAAKLMRHIVRKIEAIWRLDKSKAYSINVFTENQQIELSHLIAIQALRTRESRDYFVEFSEKTLRAIVDLIMAAEFPDSRNEIKSSVKLNKNFVRIIQAQLILGKSKISEAILNHIWLIGINQTSRPLFTSDHPVATQAHLDYSGYSSEGIEIAFPINSKIILILLEKSHFAQYAHLHNKLLSMTLLETVTHLNRLQIHNSHRQVYCNEDKFDLVKEICKSQPDVCSEHKSRIDIISGLGRAST
jgi:hypothetical protein